MSIKRAVLAYSGGLDTSVIVVWLRDQGYEVHAVLVDVGQDEDIEAHCGRAVRYGASSAVVRDARPEMLGTVVPKAIGLAATYEGNYRLGTALARPFIARAQVARARELGGATLVHGATGKGNDQIRFEFGYRSLAPDLPVLAPWKAWSITGREDLVAYLRDRGYDDDFDTIKTLSMDENLWHLSVEGGPLEDPLELLRVDDVLDSVSDRFATTGALDGEAEQIELTIERGVPVAINGIQRPLGDLLNGLNRTYRFSPWAWDLVIENRFTGVKSRGIYINPGAKLLQLAVTALAQCCLNKPTFDRYTKCGKDYGTLLYRGEYFTDQRLAVEAAADAILSGLSGTVTMRLTPVPYAAKIDAARSLFRRDLSTFESSDFTHAHADGLIQLTWLSAVGRPFVESEDENVMEEANAVTSDVRTVQQLTSRRLVPAPL